MNRMAQNPWLHRYALFVAFATFLLVIAGALVTSNDAGLSVPDWPTSFGSFRMPRMVGGVKWEHGHRMVAGTVIMLTVVLALWLWLKESRRWVRRLGGVAVLVIIAQALLGGITVLFYLPVAVSVGHATLAQVFFCLTVSVALFTRGDWRWDETEIDDLSMPSLRQLSAATTGSILLQLILGAAFRHSGFGITPHLLGAVLVAILVAWAVARVLLRHRNEPRLRGPALALGILLAVQLFLGFGSYILKLMNRDSPQPMPWVVAFTTIHVAVGALVLGASLVLTLQAFRLAASRKPRPGTTELGVGDREKFAEARPASAGRLE